MSVKTKSIGALFVALVIILAVNPKVINNIYGTILGRLFLVCVVIFFAMNNTTLGLLVALAIITSSNQFGSFVEGTLTEGMDNQTPTTPTTVGDDNVNTNVEQGQTVLTNGAVKDVESSKQKLSQLKANETNFTNNLQLERASRSSNELPTTTTNNSNEVSAPSAGILNPTSKLEGFSSYAAFTPFNISNADFYGIKNNKKM